MTGRIVAAVFLIALADHSFQEGLKLASATATILPIDKFYAMNADTLLSYLDSLYGSSIDASDHSVFTKLTKKYEDRFFEVSSNNT